MGRRNRFISSLKRRELLGVGYSSLSSVLYVLIFSSSCPEEFVARKNCDEVYGNEQKNKIPDWHKDSGERRS